MSLNWTDVHVLWDIGLVSALMSPPLLPCSHLGTHACKGGYCYEHTASAKFALVFKEKENLLRWQPRMTGGISTQCVANCIFL